MAVNATSVHDDGEPWRVTGVESPELNHNESKGRGVDCFDAVVVTGLVVVDDDAVVVATIDPDVGTIPTSPIPPPPLV